MILMCVGFDIANVWLLVARGDELAGADST
jgi:hypothetical protein